MERKEARNAFDIALVVAEFLFVTRCFAKAVDLYSECLALSRFHPAIDLLLSPQRLKCIIYPRLSRPLLCLGFFDEAMKLNQQVLEINGETVFSLEKAASYDIIGEVHRVRGQYEDSKTSYEKCLENMKAVGNKQGEIKSYHNLGEVCYAQGHYEESINWYKEGLAISKEIGDGKAEGIHYNNLATVYRDVGEYKKAIECCEKSLKCSKTVKDRREAGRAFSNLASIHDALEEYRKVIKYSKEALTIFEAIGDKQGEGTCTSYANLGNAYYGISEYQTSIEHHEKALQIRLNIGDKSGEGRSYNCLGKAYYSLGKYEKSINYFEKSLKVNQEVGSRRDEGISYSNISAVYQTVGKFDKSIEYCENGLQISKENRNRSQEETSYNNLGSVYHAKGQYQKSIVYLEKGLKLCKELGNRNGEGTYSNNLGIMYYTLGQYERSIEHFEKGLEIKRMVEDRQGEGISYDNLGRVYYHFGEYDKSIKIHEKGLGIFQEIGNRQGEGASYSHLGSVFSAVGQYEKAIEYHKKGHGITKELGDRPGESVCCCNLGTVYYALGQHEKGIEFQEKSLQIVKEIGFRRMESALLQNLGISHTSQGNLFQGVHFLFQGIRSHESSREFLADEHKLTLDDQSVSLYKKLCALLLFFKDVTNSLFIAERGRARALVDLVSKQYAIQEVNETNGWNVDAMGRLIAKQQSDFVFTATLDTGLNIWFVDKNEKKSVNFVSTPDSSNRNTEEYLQDLIINTLRSVCTGQSGEVEDRSLSALYGHEMPTSEMEMTFPRGNDEQGNRESEQSNLYLLYKIVIAPVAKLIEGPEIIVVPEGHMFLIPFAALQDSEGKYTSEYLRFRLIPSLTTLKLIQDSPADHHNQCGALVVGDPDVGRVGLPSLPKARKEAQTIARLLGVSCITGEQATKEKILHKIGDVCVVHFAAHGNAERGEIALAPNRTVDGIPKKEDFILTMEDIAKVGIRAKLVVLSCCHSGRGRILTAEGVVGIARAFLGSGARSVLVSLWAVDDEATLTFMSSFYKGLIQDKLCASEALFQSMKKLRESEQYRDVRFWAPFVLLGDDVRLEF